MRNIHLQRVAKQSLNQSILEFILDLPLSLFRAIMAFVLQESWCRDLGIIRYAVSGRLQNMHVPALFSGRGRRHADVSDSQCNMWQHQRLFRRRF